MKTTAKSNHRPGWIKVAGILLSLILTIPQLLPAADSPAKPASVVKLIFIHHSCGQNWLEDGYGKLGLELGANNYFASDTNYGWGPDNIGDRTDITDWLEWFRGPDSEEYMAALYAEYGQNSSYTRSLADPGGQNEVVMFKSCYPNSALEGNPNDPADDSNPGLNVGYAKYVYNELLKYFKTRPDKLFIVITAPPLSDATYAENARAFNNWLVFDWLTDNAYPFHNVAVFDFYNVLTAPGAHHWWYNNAIRHVAQASNTLYYPSGDDHPSIAGSLKAKNEFVPLLNVYYNRWKELDTVVTRWYSSLAGEDGWVLESAEGSNIGGSLNSSLEYFKVGDCDINRRYRAFLSFDTRTIPDNAIVASATLKVKYQGKGNENPMDWADLKADIKKGYFGTSRGLQVTDYQAPVGNAGLASAADFGETLSGGWYIANALSDGLPYISKTGWTQFRLRFSPGTDGDSTPDNLRLYSGDALAGNRPRLVVIYVVQ